MGDNQNWSNIGEQIRDAVQDALESGDFKELNNIVAGSATTALSEAKRQMKAVAEEVKEAGKAAAESAKQGSAGWTGGHGSPGNQGRAGDPGSQAGAGGAGGWTGRAAGPGNSNGWTGGAGRPGSNGWTGGAGRPGNNGWAGGAARPGGNGWTGGYNRNRYAGGSKDTFHYKKAQGQTPNINNEFRNHLNQQAQQLRNLYTNRVKTRRVGSVAGTLYIVFGSIGIGFAALILTAFLGLGIVAGSGFELLAFPILMLIGFSLMLDRGIVKKERLKRAQRYIQLCEGKSYVNIEDLALQTGKSKRFVLRDVKRMIKVGIFQEGHLDKEETCLMLDDATYRQYLSLQKERRAQEMEQKVAEWNKKPERMAEQAEAEAAQAQEEAAAEGLSPELLSMISEGQECIRKLRDMNDAIEGEVISAKLFQLENLLKEIFDRVKEHPEQMTQMHKFMEYYLPTTLKLVQAYSEFDSISAPGDDILIAKSEIEKTLDTINSAFIELLNNLFRDAVFDVTTDAQVLQTMLAKEGLTRELEPVRR